MFDISLFCKSLKNALNGIRHTWKSEQNFRFQSLMAILVIALMFVLQVSIVEKVLLLGVVCLVLVAELINTAFERMADVLKPRIHPYIAQIKDIMAGMVLFSSIASIIIGLIIFIPYILKILG